jgi:hypothetical protein
MQNASSSAAIPIAHRALIAANRRRSPGSFLGTRLMVPAAQRGSIWFVSITRFSTRGLVEPRVAIASSTSTRNAPWPCGGHAPLKVPFDASEFHICIVFSFPISLSSFTRAVVRPTKPTAAIVTLASSASTSKGSNRPVNCDQYADFEDKEECEWILCPRTLPVSDDDDIMPADRPQPDLKSLLTALRSDKSSGAQLTAHASVALINDLVFGRLNPSCPHCEGAMKSLGVSEDRKFILFQCTNRNRPKTAKCFNSHASHRPFLHWPLMGPLDRRAAFVVARTGAWPLSPSFLKLNKEGKVTINLAALDAARRAATPQPSLPDSTPTNYGTLDRVPWNGIEHRLLTCTYAELVEALFRIYLCRYV